MLLHCEALRENRLRDADAATAFTQEEKVEWACMMRRFTKKRIAPSQTPDGQLQQASRRKAIPRMAS
eukprot:4894758-Prorocentrum_lima.AAC.1